MSRARDFADLAGSADAGGLTGRNMVKNGAMLVSQRGASFTSSSSAYTLDRFQVLENFGAAFTITQSDTVPDNAQFTKSLKMDCTTAATPSGSNEEFKLVYRMEGYDFLPSGYGNSYAKNLTLSFWVRSNLTGTYRINFMSRSGTNRNIGATYTISSANTWEKKEITFIPDTSVSPYQDHQDAFRIEWYLASSSDRTTGSMPTSWATMDNATRATGLNVNMASSTDNEWYITGVQLEVGEKATPFEHRSFGDELERCKRYFQQIGSGYGKASSTSAFDCSVTFNPPMRANPTVSDNGTVIQITNITSADHNQSSVSCADTDTGVTDGTYGGGRVRFSNFSGLTSGTTYAIDHTGSQGGAAAFDAEL